jgi:hypothetical protein
MPRKSKKSVPKSSGKKQVLEERIIENLIALQKVNLSMVEKFDKLSRQMSDLLSLFEMAAKSFAENPETQISQKDREFLEKIDRLLDQNKTIANGLTLMEERIRDRLHGPHTEDKKDEEFEEKLSKIEKHPGI